MKVVKSTSTEQTKEIAANIAAELRGGDVLCLRGDLGAGKTTFTQGLLTALGVPAPYPSPTFTIVNMYDGPKAEGLQNVRNNIETIYHIDAYRITENDLRGIGWDAMISDENAIIILEWPERIRDATPSDAKSIHFTALDENENTRELRFENF